MKKAIIAIVLIVLVVATSAGATAAKTSLHYAGVTCNRRSTTTICSLDSQRGYLVGISANALIVMKWGASKPTFVREENGDRTVGAPQRANNLIGNGAGCETDPRGPGIACALTTGGGYGFEMTRSSLLVLNIDTNKNVFLRSTG